MDVTLRALARGDIPAWNRLLADIERVDHTFEHYNEADLLEEMANPDIVLGRDMVGAFDGDELVGYFCVYLRPGGQLGDEILGDKIQMEGSVHPQRRGEGIGTLLAEAMMARATASHEERGRDVPALYLLRGMAGDTAQAGLMAAIGLHPERWTFVMRADLAGLPDPAPLRDGLAIRGYDASLPRLMHETHNLVFRDHPNFTPWTDVMWAQWVTGSRNFRPELSFVVVDPRLPGVLAAYLQTNEYDAHFEATGRREAYVAKVGTRREHRGCGVATTLLQHSLRAYREAGYDEASLDVDSENPTGALGVYERAGFMVETTRTDYTRRTG